MENNATNDRNISQENDCSLEDKRTHIHPSTKDYESALMNYLSDTDKCRFDEFKDVLEVCHWAIENNVVLF